MRVITGKARGMKLKSLEGTELIRPTADAVKEAMFSIVQFDVEDAVVLDLFAGSGQLGIEALSRGAKKAYFVDSSREAVGIIKKSVLCRRVKPVYIEKTADCGSDCGVQIFVHLDKCLPAIPAVFFVI